MNRIYAVGAALALLFASAAPVRTAYAQASSTPAAPASPGQADCSSTAFMQKVFDRESKSSGGYKAVNPDTKFIGGYQMGWQSLQEAGYATSASTSNTNIVWAKDSPVQSVEEFLGNPAAQDQAYRLYAKKTYNYIDSNAKSYVGKTFNGTLITESSLVYANQFGHGRVNEYFRNGGVCNAATSDKPAPGKTKGTCVSEYLQLGSGYDVSDILGKDGGITGKCNLPAGNQEPYSGDTTSRTCPPTVSMLQSIPCLSYPASLVGFCMRYKPLQMGMSECRDAENYAQSVPPSGPQLDACKQQTFGGGTGSWSYVLACAKAQPAQGQTGEAKKSLGAADDPACYERLKGMGLQIEEKGKVDISTGGRTCIIPNATGWSGGTIPLSQKVTLNCALVEQLEDFSKAAAGMGISRMEVLGTLSCRGINNTKGTGQAKTSLHGTGNAIDINGFTVNGASVPTSRYFTNAGSRAFFDGMIQLGCSKFDGTLAFRFYKKKWTHVHWQATQKTNCDPNG